MSSTEQEARERQEMQTAIMYRAKVRHEGGRLVADLAGAFPGAWEHLQAAGFSQGPDGIWTKGGSARTVESSAPADDAGSAAEEQTPSQKGSRKSHPHR